jgi:chloramphenicol O-acetyltransferase
MPSNHDTQYEDECACGHERQEHSMPTEYAIENQPDTITTSCNRCSCKEFVPPKNTDVCECTHERQEHDGPCKEESCPCEKFVFDGESNSTNFRTVSILEDEADFADSIAANLENQRNPKINIEWSKDKEELQTSNLPITNFSDLFIIDVQMLDEGGQTGPEIVRKFMELNKIYRPCIIMTGQPKKILDDIKEEHKDFVYFEVYLDKNDKNFAEALTFEVNRLLQKYSGCKAAFQMRKQQFKEYKLLSELPAEKFSWRDIYGQDGIVGEKETYADLLDWCIKHCNSLDENTSDKVKDATRVLDERLKEHSLKRYETEEVYDEVDDGVDDDDDGDKEDE